MSRDNEVLFGMTQDHLTFDESINRYFHKDTYLDFLKLKTIAKAQGFELYVTSSYRSFDDQLRIWNAKCMGEKPLYDRLGDELDYSSMSENDIVSAIINWSALPGTSRHHWGCDMDVVDKLSWPEGYHIMLTPDEFAQGGPFENFSTWLDSEIGKIDFPYFRPYLKDNGGVAPEAWHISHKKISKNLEDSYTLEVFNELLNHERMKDLKFLDIVKNRSDEIYHHFFESF